MKFHCVLSSKTQETFKLVAFLEFDHCVKQFLRIFMKIRLFKAP